MSFIENFSFLVNWFIYLKAHPIGFLLILIPILAITYFLCTLAIFLPYYLFINIPLLAHFSYNLIFFLANFSYHFILILLAHPNITLISAGLLFLIQPILYFFPGIEVIVKAKLYDISTKVVKKVVETVPLLWKKGLFLVQALRRTILY